MKTRWMKSVIKHSQTPAPVLPYHRGKRGPSRTLRQLTVVPRAKTA